MLCCVVTIAAHCSDLEIRSRRKLDGKLRSENFLEAVKVYRVAEPQSVKGAPAVSGGSGVGAEMIRSFGEKLLLVCVCVSRSSYDVVWR